MLKPRKRLARAKLKEDTFITQTARVQTFIDSNRNKLIYGLLAIVAIIVIVGGIRWSQAKADKEAAFLSLQLRDTFGKGLIEESLTQADIILEDYPNSRYTAVALMTKARIFEQQGLISDAISAYNELMKKHDDLDYLAFGACFSLGSLHFGSEEYDQAAQWFSEAASRYPKHFNAPYALLEAGKSYIKLNKYDQAKSVLRKALTEYPKSRAIDQIRQELEEIEFMQ